MLLHRDSSRVEPLADFLLFSIYIFFLPLRSSNLLPFSSILFLFSGEGKFLIYVFVWRLIPFAYSGPFIIIFALSSGAMSFLVSFIFVLSSLYLLSPIYSSSLHYMFSLPSTASRILFHRAWFPPPFLSSIHLPSSLSPFLPSFIHSHIVFKTTWNQG